jgi:predicted transcriptional regulator
MDRKLNITVGDEDRAALKARVKNAVATGTYQGEYMNFATPELLFTRLNDNRWKILHALIGMPEIGVRELARRISRDVRRVYDDAAILVDLGLLEKTDAGKLHCPFVEIHVDMRLRKAA